ncbi:MAG: protein phosphatase 2C domain-containing protein, partial [Chloroflexota bacterium]|nr:protein phosphatase 2C domain-containing protein [Chloroflexota bacterium]
MAATGLEHPIANGEEGPQPADMLLKDPSAEPGTDEAVDNEPSGTASDIPVTDVNLEATPVPDADSATAYAEETATDEDSTEEATAEETTPPAQVEPQTAPLSESTDPEGLTPLPANAVVDGRYVVQSQLHHGADRNLYRVTARRQQRCTVCGRLSSVDVDNCERCGSILSDQPPAEFYLMAESYRPESLMQDPGLMKLNLYHPNLVPVIDFFDYKPFGQNRYYAVAEPRQGVRLSQLSLPRPGAQVLNWTMQLADALDYLHDRGVVGAGAEADDILVQGDRASLASLQNARATGDADERTTQQQQSMDLARLAGTMYEAYTGHPAAMSPEGILPMPSAAPDRVGAAFRAAIEPVQGAAPPITAAMWRAQLSLALEALVELERPSRPVSFVAAGHTDAGRLRELNEDSYGMAEFLQTSVERPTHMGLFIVADGMGGHKGGEVASAIAVQAFCGEVIGRTLAPLATVTGERSTPNNETILQGLIRGVQSANDRIFKAREEQHTDMGTTMVAMLVAGGKAYITNVGDSRFYMYTTPRKQPQREVDTTSPLALDGTSPLPGNAPPREGDNQETASPERPDENHTGETEREPDYALAQVSVDHSLVHRLVELGQLDAEEAKTHPHRNFIYRSLGGPPPIEVDTFVRTLRPGDRLLLCSD